MSTVSDQQVATSMMYRLQVFVITVIFTLSCSADSTSLQQQADAALESGDMETALEQYIALTEVLPESGETLDMAADLAQQLGVTDLAIDLWQQRVDLAINQGDKVRAAEVNAEITTLRNLIPSWVEEKFNAATQIQTEDEAEAYQLLEAMSSEANEAMQNGDVEAAISAQESALMIAQDIFGEVHWFTVIANRDLGYIYRQIGLFDEAEKFYSAALIGAEESLGEGHPNTLEINAYIAELYSAMGLAEESQLLLEMVTAGFETSLGEYHWLTIDAKSSEFGNLKATGQFQPALKMLTQLCAFIETGYGAYHPRSLDCLGSTASLQSALGLASDAEETYEMIIARMSFLKTDLDVDVLNTLTQVSELYRLAGRYQESKDLLSNVIQNSLQIGAVETSYIAKGYLGRVFNNVGELKNAEDVTQEVLGYGMNHWQGEPIKVFNTLLELGAIYQSRGKLALAESTFEEALAGLVEVYGASNPSALVAANNLGQLYERSGLYDKAEPIIKQTLAQMEATLGEDHPDTIRVRNNLGLLYESQGNFREAEPLYKKSLEMITVKLGPNHTDTIAIKNNLAYLYMIMEKFDESAAMFTDVKEQWTVLFGRDHPNTLKATNNLGRIYQKLGRLPEAEQEILAALEARQRTLGERHIDSIRSMIDLGGVYLEQNRLDEAKTLLTQTLEYAEKELGNLHPYTFEALNYLSQAKLAAGELALAADLMEVGFERRSKFFDTMLWTTGENAREGYLRLHRGEFNNYLTVLAKINDTTAAKRAVDASLQRKGLLLKVTSEIQQIATMTTDPALVVLATKLQDARKKLAALTLAGPTAKTKGRHTEALYELEREVNELQGELGRASVRFRTSLAKVNTERLEKAIQEGAALVDFQYFNEGGEKKILATVMHKIDGEVEYSLIKYSDARMIEEAIVEYRTIIQDDSADEDDILEAGMLAYEQVWQPLNDALDETDYVYLIPDGMLNILPFNALVDEDESYLIQTHDLHILTSGRDLIPNDYQLASGNYMVLAGPNYDSKDVVPEAEMTIAKGRRSATLKMGIRGAGGGLRGLSFLPLPGAEKEGRIIIDEVVKGNGESENFFGDVAEEKVLSNMETAPEILHIATHGFFLKADDTLRKRILKAQRSVDFHVPPPGDNPLLRAGLAFAGINTNAQFLGDIDTSNDGVLTALEVLDLNLSGTRLVVLSACETGLGEIHEGEGVYGLRRSFQEAGVAEVVSSLWAVSDAGTQALMTEFYNKLLAGTPAREALRETQLDLLDSPEWGYPYIWSAFMIVGSYESAGFNVQ